LATACLIRDPLKWASIIVRVAQEFLNHLQRLAAHHEMAREGVSKGDIGNQAGRSFPRTISSDA
jgi:hypothetical protein